MKGTFMVDWWREAMSAVAAVVAVSACMADWPTARGNSQRTGCIDGKPGPAAPKVIWGFKSQDHYVASPVPGKDRLHVAGLGAFNVASVLALPLDPKGTPAPVWQRSTPLLKLPVVSAPALVGDRVLFGDGMHQTDGAILHCLRADGFPIWQYPMPGTLVHLEGAPAVAGPRVVMGAGAGGVVCLDRDRAVLEGKELDAAGIQAALDAKWKELLAKYEQDKKKDPDFAVKPNEDQLPKPAPVKLWQVGMEKWHVDAPVCIVGDAVLVTSAFLDKEKVGDRALHCLDLATGASRWRQPLIFNPWGGASVDQQTIVVAGSSVNYDPKSLKGAKGDIAAFDLATGKPLWRKEIATGGVVAGAVLADGLAITTATDGKVRAFDLKTGDRRWIYDAKAPMFAPAAVSSGVAYVGDLKGVVHAITLADGKEQWKLDLGADPVKAPGMIYAGLVLQDGRLYVATCNIEGPTARQPTAVICIGAK